MSERRPQQGFTLLEIMVALAAAGFALAGMSAAMYYQQRTYFRQLGYIQAQQNARASIAILERYIRMAGWGTVPSDQRAGVASIGACYSNSNDLQQQLECDNIDPDNTGASGAGTSAGNDRLRVLAMVAGDGNGFVQSATGHSSTPLTVDCPIGSGQPLVDNTYALVSGKCTGGSPAYGLDLIKVTGGGGSCSGTVTYSATSVETGSSLVCPIGFAADFTFGKAVLADFYIDRSSDLKHPILRLRLGADQSINGSSPGTGTPYVVAYDIDDLQLQYGIDTHDASGSSNADGVVDEWCNDPNASSCASGTSFTTEEKLARIIAVRVAIVTRTADYYKELDTGTVKSLTVQDHTYPNINDGYKRWVYRATVALRNNIL